MKLKLPCTWLLLSPLLGGAAHAADPARGAQLYENHCRGCHESIVHIRAQTKARSLADIRYQITRWQEELKLPWTAEEIADVQAYLNDRYYHYPD
jgi:mono/diheme cytochrome c family protein